MPTWDISWIQRCDVQLWFSRDIWEDMRYYDVHLFYMQCPWKASEVTFFGGSWSMLHCHGVIGQLDMHAILLTANLQIRVFLPISPPKINMDPIFWSRRITTTLILHAFPHKFYQFYQILGRNCPIFSHHLAKRFLPRRFPPWGFPNGFPRGAPRRSTCPKWRRRGRRNPKWRRPWVDAPRGPTASEPGSKNDEEKWGEIWMDFHLCLCHFYVYRSMYVYLCMYIYIS